MLIEFTECCLIDSVNSKDAPFTPPGLPEKATHTCGRQTLDEAWLRQLYGCPGAPRTQIACMVEGTRSRFRSSWISSYRTAMVIMAALIVAHAVSPMASGSSKTAVAPDTKDTMFELVVGSLFCWAWQDNYRTITRQLKDN